MQLMQARKNTGTGTATRVGSANRVGITTRVGQQQREQRCLPGSKGMTYQVWEGGCE